MPTTHAPYLRATVSGRRRYADLVLPTDEPVSLLVPQLLELLDEPQDLGQVHLATSLGTVLDPGTPLSQTDLVDGVRLRLVTQHDLPPAPVVHDLVDVVEQSEAPGRWTERNRETTLAVLGGLVVLAAALLGLREVPGLDGTPGLVGAAVLLLGSLVASLVGARGIAWSGAAVGLLLAAELLRRSDPGGAEGAVLTGALLLAAIAAVSWCTRRPVPGALSAGVLVGLGGVALLVWTLTDDVVRTAAVVGVVAVLVLGLTPRLALGSSGVFALDSRLAEGDDVARVNALDAVARAHWSLTGAALVAAAVFGVAAYALGSRSEAEPWSVGLTVVLSLALALRARHFPLALHRGALWAAALAGALGLVEALQDRWVEHGSWVLGGLAAVGVVLALLGVVRRTPLQQARSRRRANQLETTTILLSVPVALGVFGVYQDLLGTF